MARPGAGRDWLCRHAPSLEWGRNHRFMGMAAGTARRERPAAIARG